MTLQINDWPETGWQSHNHENEGTLWRTLIQ